MANRPPQQSSAHSAQAHPPPPPSSVSEDGTTSKLEELDVPPVDISILREIAKRQLIDTLNAVNGAKTLVLDPSLAGPLGLVTEVALLKHHGVDKMFWLEQGPLNATTRNVVYLCRPQIKWMKILADQIKRLSATSAAHTFTLVLVPRRTTLCDRILEEEGVFGEVNISSYKMEFIPLENDLVSLEYDNVFKEIWLDGDETSIYYAARALITIQQAYGLFPRIIGKGDAAKKLTSLLLHLRAFPPNSASASSQQLNSGANLSNPSEIIDSLVIIDRSTDMITPLLTQLTYEGLVDEFLGIRNSHVEVDAALLNPPATQSVANPSTSSVTPALSTSTVAPKKKKHHLTASSDPLFGELRDMNFAVVGTKLNKEARRLDAAYKGRHEAQTVAQLRDFVGKLGGLQNEHQVLRLHTGLSEVISPLTRTDIFNKSLEIQQNLVASYDPNTQITAIEDLISQQAPVQFVLRLVCLASLTTGGLKVKVLENLKKEIAQTYGYDLVPLLLSLTSLSLLLPNPLPKPRVVHSNSTFNTPSIPSPPFAPIRKAFRLLSETNEAAPTDISYTYSGYAPISIRLVQCVVQKDVVLSPLGSTSTPNETGNVAGTTAQEVVGKAGKVDKVTAHPITGWKGFEEAIKLIPGEVVDEVQSGTNLKGTSTTLALPGPQLVNQERTTTTVVFFLGGCTFTEVASLRWMAQHTRGRRFLIATTGMINGSTIMESLAPAGKFKAAFGTA